MTSCPIGSTAQMAVDEDRRRRNWTYDPDNYDQLAPRTTDLRREAVEAAIEEERRAADKKGRRKEERIARKRAAAARKKADEETAGEEEN